MNKLIELNFKIKVINYLNSKNINYSWLKILKTYDNFRDNPTNIIEDEIDSIVCVDHDTKENIIINNYFHRELIIMRSSSNIEDYKEDEDYEEYFTFDEFKSRLLEQFIFHNPLIPREYLINKFINLELKDFYFYYLNKGDEKLTYSIFDTKYNVISY